MCETRALGIKWPHWHTLIFSNDTKTDMRFVCPKDVKKMLVQRAVYWKKWAAKHGYEEFQRGNVAGTRASSLAEEGEGQLDRKAPKCGQEDLFGRRLDAKKTVRYRLAGHQPMSSLQQKRKGQKSTGYTTAQNGTKSDERLLKFSRSWSKKQEPQRRSCYASSQ